MLRRAGLLAGLAAGLAMMQAPAAHAETTTIGEVAPSSTPSPGCLSCTDFQLATGVAPGYLVPAGNWTIVSWSWRQGASATGCMQLRVFRPTTPGRFRVVAESPFSSAPAGEVGNATVSIPVQGGDTLGLQTGPGPGGCTGTNTITTFGTATPADNAALVVGGPTVGEEVGLGTTGGDYGIASSTRVNVAATLFRDTESPDASIRRGPKKRTHKRRARFVFESSEPGSSFQCKLDGRPAAPCTSPKVYKKLSARKHTFRLTAIDAAGNPDTTPAIRRFKILED